MGQLNLIIVNDQVFKTDLSSNKNESPLEDKIKKELDERPNNLDEIWEYFYD